MALGLACFFLGSWLGMRFKVAILVPAIFAVIVATWCVGLLGGQPNSLVIGAQIVAAMAIQAGYLTAALIIARFAKADADIVIEDVY
jgi:hypothetical protein